MISTRFRLLAALPLDVAFRGITYRLAVAQVPVAGLWQLEARGPGGFWLIAHAGSEEALRRRLYKEGVEFGRATVGRTIFERLVKEGWAEMVAA